MKSQFPSLDQWITEAKKNPDAHKVGMYLFHNGVVRSTPKAEVRDNAIGQAPVVKMQFSYDPAKAGLPWASVSAWKKSTPSVPLPRPCSASTSPMCCSLSVTCP